MAGYRMKVLSFDGDAAIAEGGADYNAYFEADGDPLATYEQDPVVAEVARDHPRYVRAQPRAKLLGMTIELRNLDQAKIDALKQKFTQRDDTEKYLVVEDGSGTQRRLAVAVLGLVTKEPPAVFTAVLFAARAVWESIAETDGTKTVTASPTSFTTTPDGGDATAPTNSGSNIVRPRVTITPQAYKNVNNSPRYMRHVAIANRSPLALNDAFGNGWPVDITNGGWDVDSLINASPPRLHPQGYDVRVLVDGIEVERYLSNWGAGFWNDAGDPPSTNPGNPFSTFDTFLPGAAWHGQAFMFPGCSEKEQLTVASVRLWLRKVGAPTGNLNIEICADNGNKPGTVLHTAQSLDVSTLTTSFAERTLTFAAAPVLTAKTKYWLVIKPPTGGTHNSTNYVEMLGEVGQYEGDYFAAHSHDGGTTWYVGVSLLALFGSTEHSAMAGITNIRFKVLVSGDAKIWVPAPLASGVRLTLAQQMNESSSSVIIAEHEGHVRLPDAGWLLIDTEWIRYRTKTGTRALASLLRGCGGTTAAAHLAGAAIHAVDHMVQVVYGQEAGNAKPETEPDELAPAIDGVASTNTEHRWIGPFLCPGEETRSGAWLTEFDDGVDLASSVSIDADPAADLVEITFEDDRAGSTFMQRNVAAQVFPPGIKRTASAISFKATIPDELVLEVLGTNGGGVESVLQTFRSADTPSPLTTLGIDLTNVDQMYRLRLRARHKVITGANASGGTAIAVASGSPKAMLFTLEAASVIEAIAFRVAEGSTAPTQSLNIDLYRVNDDDEQSVDTSVKLMPTQTITPAETTTAYATISKTVASAVRLDAGVYAFTFTTADTAGYLLQASDGSVYPNGEARQGGQIVLSISADYDADATAGGTLDEVGTTLVIGSPSSPNQERAAIRFPLSSLPANASVGSVAFSFEVMKTAPSHVIHVGAYGTVGDQPGQADPDADSGADLYTSCRLNPMPSYGFLNAEIESTGVKTASLGGTVVADLTAANAAGGDRFSLALFMTGSGSDTAEIAAIEHASAQEPRLIVTYTPSATASYTTRIPQDIWFRVFGTPTQGDTPVGSGNQLIIDEIVIKLDDATPRTPLVVFQQADQDCYYLQGTLENVTTGQSVTLRAPLQIGDELDIDFATMAVTLSDDDLADTAQPNAIGAVSDLGNAFSLMPGSNTLRWTEGGVTDTDIRLRYRDEWL